MKKIVIAVLFTLAFRLSALLPTQCVMDTGN